MQEFASPELKSGDRTWQVIVESNGDNVYIYTIYGQVNKIQSAKTQIYGKNIGKSNETTNLEQAIKQAQSMINKKSQAGYSAEVTSSNVKRLFPMAVSPFDPKKIKFPCMAQAKLDGIRMIASDKLLSRRLHDIIGFEHIKEETDALLAALPDCNFIDGELYKHGMMLQDISGIVRGSDLDSKLDLEFHIFDFSIDNMGFHERFVILKETFSRFDFMYLKLVESTLVENQTQADEYYESLVNQGYEGIIYKQCSSLYEARADREKRSTKCVKRKVSLEDEFTIVNFGAGVGKFEDCVVFTLKTKEGNEFQCVPTGSTESRKDIYSRCLQDFSQFEGKLATVRFDAWSSNKVPLRGIIVNLDRID